MESDDDSIDIRYIEARESLEVRCGPKKLRKFVEFLCNEASLDGTPKTPPNQVSHVFISENINKQSGQLIDRGWKDRVALLGCALMVVAVIFVGFVCVVGLRAIATGFLNSNPR